MSSIPSQFEGAATSFGGRGLSLPKPKLGLVMSLSLCNHGGGFAACSEWRKWCVSAKAPERISSQDSRSVTPFIDWLSLIDCFVPLLKRPIAYIIPMLHGSACDIEIWWARRRKCRTRATRFSFQIFSGFNLPKIINIGQFLTELFEKMKGGHFWDMVYLCLRRCVFLLLPFFGK